MTRQLTLAVRHKLLRSPHAKRPPHGRLCSSRLAFTDGEKWRLRLLIVFLSHGAADATLDPGL